MEKPVKKYDYNIITQLHELFLQDAGCTFLGWSNNLALALQVRFHEECLQIVKPKYVLETGTHKALYSYLLKINLPNVRVHTFGIDEESQKCVDFLNNHFKENFITFHLGDSKETLSGFMTNIPFDLAWVDGDHFYEGAYLDLVNCARLNIGHILIDDVNSPSVEHALAKFLEEHSQYQLKKQSPFERKITWLEKVAT